MKFLGAYQSVNELSEKVAILEQEKKKAASQLVVITKEEHKEEAVNLLDIEVKTVDEELETGEEPLEQFGLSHKDAQLYDETIRLGGYVLLEKEENTATHSTGTRDAKEDPISDQGTGDIPAPGFGVSQDDPARRN